MARFAALPGAISCGQFFVPLRTPEYAAKCNQRISPWSIRPANFTSHGRQRPSASFFQLLPVTLSAVRVVLFL